jgi:cell division protein FtsB
MIPDQPEAPGPAAERRPRVRRRLRTPGEARVWRRRMAGYGLAGVFVLVLVNALMGEGGYLATIRARGEVEELDAQLRQVERENLDLLERARKMQKDPRALEDAARELGLIYPGETLIIIKDAEPVPSHPQPAPERGR